MGEKELVVPQLSLEVEDVLVDLEDGWVYFVDEQDIKRAELASPENVELLFTDRNTPGYLQLGGNGELYWSEFGGAGIFRGRIGSGNIEQIIDAEDGLTGPRGFKIVEDKVYVVNSKIAGASAILEYDMESDELNVLYDVEDNIGSMIYDLEVDKVNGYLYWIDSKGQNHNDPYDGRLLRASLDGKRQPQEIFQNINYGYRLVLGE